MGAGPLQVTVSLRGHVEVLGIQTRVLATEKKMEPWGICPLVVAAVRSGSAHLGRWHQMQRLLLIPESLVGTRKSVDAGGALRPQRVTSEAQYI
jgi:hypothetical protein